MSPRAHPLIGTKTFRLLAAVYHPDNTETGDQEAFKHLAHAYRILSDPVRRAAYDRERLGAPGPLTAGPMEGGDSLQSPERREWDEQELRSQILRALYDVRRGRPYKPGLSLRYGVLQLAGTGTGALASGDADVYGGFFRIVEDVGNTAEILAGASSLIGTGAMTPASSQNITGTGDAVAGAASVQAAAYWINDGTGALAVAASTVAGAGTTTAIADLTGSGDLVADSSIVVGLQLPAAYITPTPFDSGVVPRPTIVGVVSGGTRTCYEGSIAVEEDLRIEVEVAQ